jgi:hypothetical protein
MRIRTTPAIRRRPPTTINTIVRGVLVTSGHDTVTSLGAGKRPSDMISTLKSSGIEAENVTVPVPEFSDAHRSEPTGLGNHVSEPLRGKTKNSA